MIARSVIQMSCRLKRLQNWYSEHAATEVAMDAQITVSVMQKSPRQAWQRPAS